jgi:hypothetical protein
MPKVGVSDDNTLGSNERQLNSHINVTKLHEI